MFFQTFSSNMNVMKKCFKMLIMLFEYQHLSLLYKSAATYCHEKESILLAFENSDCQLGNTFRIVPNFRVFISGLRPSMKTLKLGTILNVVS